MKKPVKVILSCFVVMMLSLTTYSQGMQMDAQSQLKSINQHRLTLNHKSMLVLGGWSVANLSWSGYQMSKTTGEDYHFYQMNVAWNAVNISIAGLGFWGAMRQNASDFDLSKTVKEQYNIQSILLLNTGLDVAYMAGGAYLLERAKTDLDNADRWNGFGKSLILQGGFLFAFDIVQYALHLRNQKRLQHFLRGVDISVSNGLYLSYRF